MNTRARGIAVSTVGYMFIGIAGWMLAMSPARWYTHTLGAAFLLPLTIVLAIIGILAFVTERGLDSVVFFGAAGILGSIFAYEGMLTTAHVMQPVSYLGWFACMWTIYFLCVWVGSLRSGVTRSLFLLGLWLTCIVLAIGAWTGVAGWMIAGGYLGLITAALAFITAGSEIIHHGMIANPNVELPGTGPGTVSGTAHPMAAD